MSDQPSGSAPGLAVKPDAALEETGAPKAPAVPGQNHLLSGQPLLSNGITSAWMDGNSKVQAANNPPSASGKGCAEGTSDEVATTESISAKYASADEPADLAKHPILQQWEWNIDGSISGRVYGKRGFKDGEAMNTSIVPEGSRFSTYVITGSGSIYRLGERLARGLEQKALRRQLRDAHDDGTNARAGSERGAAALAKQRITGDTVVPPAAAASMNSSGSALQASEPRSPRDRKRTAAQIGVEEPKRAKSTATEPYKQALPKAMGKGDGKAATPPDRPKHPNQYTKLHEAQQQQQQAQRVDPEQQHLFARKAPVSGKHPNQYTYRHSPASMEQPADGRDRRLSPTAVQRPKQPNQCATCMLSAACYWLPCDPSPHPHKTNHANPEPDASPCASQVHLSTAASRFQGETEGGGEEAPQSVHVPSAADKPVHHCVGSRANIDRSILPWCEQARTALDGAAHSQRHRRAHRYLPNGESWW